METGPVWTEADALRVIEAGDAIVVDLPGYVDCHLYANEVKDGLYTIWLDEEGFDEPIARLPWGAFKVVGFDFMLGNDEEAEAMADGFVAAGAEDQRERKKNVN